MPQARPRAFNSRGCVAHSPLAVPTSPAALCMVQLQTNGSTPPASTFPDMPQAHQQLDGGVLWANPDPFNTDGPLPESTTRSACRPLQTVSFSVVQKKGYEFPARKSHIQAHGPGTRARRLHRTHAGVPSSSVLALSLSTATAAR
ncbi:hypothetical protein FA95DRAFT_1411348 [Auriscalpium vulgare]|uniref:Uncharacterized protein n=1 Tax=Auriscalpium vulgare TaxID=40419 RepID=A0ACB8RR70_9AGAM|nr:hypothetical protein FA95DRAFT_1411348 [Auriscalpium vulgare]